MTQDQASLRQRVLQRHGEDPSLFPPSRLPFHPPAGACLARLSSWRPIRMRSLLSRLPRPPLNHVIAGSLAAVAAGYFGLRLRQPLASSQSSYRVALKPIFAAHGHRLVRELPKMAARHLVEEIGADAAGHGQPHARRSVEGHGVCD